MGTLLKCPLCDSFQTKGRFCVNDGNQLIIWNNHVELISSVQYESEDSLYCNLAKKLKLDTFESLNYAVEQTVEECVRDLVSQVEANAMNQALNKNANSFEIRYVSISTSKIKQNFFL